MIMPLERCLKIKRLLNADDFEFYVIVQNLPKVIIGLIPI